MTNASTAVQPSKLPFSRVLAAGGIAIAVPMRRKVRMPSA